jgi:hypothetical protein
MDGAFIPRAPGVSKLPGPGPSAKVVGLLASRATREIPNELIDGKKEYRQSKSVGKKGF